MGVQQFVDEYSRRCRLLQERSTILTPEEEALYQSLSGRVIGLFEALMTSRDRVLPLGLESHDGYYKQDVVQPVDMGIRIADGTQYHVYAQPAVTTSPGATVCELALWVPLGSTYTVGYLSTSNATHLGSIHFNTAWPADREMQAVLNDFAGHLNEVLGVLGLIPNDAAGSVES